MRWQNRPNPNIGETRKVKRFAWLPVYLGRGNTIWLENYEVTEKYSTQYELTSDDGYSSPVTRWRVTGVRTLN